MTETSPPIRILAVAGSLRRNSYNHRLLKAAALATPVTMTVEVHDTIADIPLFDEDREAAEGGRPTGVDRLSAAIAAADGLLLATPEYNQSLPGVLKNTVDWLSRSSAHGSVLAGKPVAITGATVGPWGTRYAQAQLRHALTAVGALTMPAPQLFVADAANWLDLPVGTSDGPAELRLRSFLQSFQDWIRRLGV